MFISRYPFLFFFQLLDVWKGTVLYFTLYKSINLEIAYLYVIKYQLHELFVSPVCSDKWNSIAANYRSIKQKIAFNYDSLSWQLNESLLTEN